MSKWLRGAAAAAVLMTVLAGCGDGDGDGDGGGGNSGKGSDRGSASGGQQSVPFLRSAPHVSQALPSQVSMGGDWRSMGTPVADSAEATSACQEDSGTACTGVLARGRVKFIRDDAATGSVFAEFSMYAFDTLENAKVASKALHTATRGKFSEEVKGVKADVGADEANTFRHSYGTLTTMRVGGVCVEVEVRSTDKKDHTDELKKFAKLQVERIKKVASHKNPDA